MTNTILYILVFIIVTAILGYYFKSRDDDFVEEFSNYNNYELKDSLVNIYDKFYTSIYDKLFGSSLRNEFEMYNIRTYTDKDFSKNEIKYLDLGCGIGDQLKILNRDKIACVGIDNSMKMLEKARSNNPTVPLINGDFHNKKMFKNREFSHIYSLFYTIYYSDKPEKVFKNANYWLKPNGYFSIHLVNKSKFDPVLENSSRLIPLFNPQRHSENRVTQTKLTFNKFKYLSDWKFSDDNVEFIEHFMFKDNTKHRQNIHKLHMNDIKYYLKLAKNNGFKLIKIIDLLPANHEFNYIYIFKKIYGE
tara:strand:- start:1407 stop:2318 length:912 start_codon:yes stop_codon:yes gene_type:complete